MSDLDQLLAAQAAGPARTTSGPMSTPQDALDSLLSARAAATSSQAAPAQPAAVQAGNAISDIPRQLGLTARYGMEGLANMAQIGTEPIRAVTDRLFGQTGHTVPLGALATQFADKIGLPKPADANERVIGDMTRMGFGTLAGAGAAQAAGSTATNALQFVGRNLPAVAQGAGQRLLQGVAANPGQQVASAVAAGGAGGAVREAGGTPMAQGVASLAGGVAGGMAANTAANIGSGIASTARNLIPGRQQLMQQRIDQRIDITLQNQGIDPATITPAMRSALRDQVGQAMNTSGDLNPQAIARLADYTRLNLTPTRARLTLDPYDVTQEQNASRLAAASGSRDARLPQIANENNRRLVGLLDEMGGALPHDPYAQGNAAISPITSQNAAMETATSNLYRQARDSAGRPALMDHVTFSQNANRALDDAMLGYALPSDVTNRLNRISSGQEGPFNVEYVEQFKKQLNGLYGNTNDRATRAAISTVRDALENTPLMGAPTVNPGNLPAIYGTVPPSPAISGQQSLDAFAQARAAHQARMQFLESSPGIQSAVDGAVPETFIRNNILSKTAGFDQVERTAQAINASPTGREAVRTAIVQHLKDAAIGKGGTSATGNFSGRAMESAIKDIGDRKLSLFFDPQEIETLRAMARTGSFETFQPRGSAVNNSNSGAAIGSMLMGLADRVRPVAGRIPGIGPVVNGLVLNPLENIGVWATQRPAMNIPGGLLTPRPQPPAGSGLLLPGLAIGGTATGLLSSP